MLLKTIVSEIESFLKKYITFVEGEYSLPLALWLVGTFLWPDFDAYPYLVITSHTKRSGKTRLMELLSFVARNSVNTGAMTVAGLYDLIDREEPTIFIDEAETASSEAASTLRAFLNMGYRKGSTVRRFGDREYETYCPKVFVLIGDVYDTLRDRSITVTMKRADAPNRFVYEPVRAEGGRIRDAITELMKTSKESIIEAYLNFKGLTFLTDRDEEIWTPLFVIASIICPDRIEELSRIAVDLATEKTGDARRYSALLGQGAEEKATEEEYAKRLLADVRGVLQAAKVKGMRSTALLEALKGIPVAPWRKFQGDGLTVHTMASLLARFGVRPGVFREGYGRDGSTTVKGYTLANVEKGVVAL